MSDGYLTVPLWVFTRLTCRFRSLYINLLYYCSQSPDGIYTCDSAGLRQVAAIYDLTSIQRQLAFLQQREYITITSETATSEWAKRRRKKVWHISLVNVI